MEFYMNTKEFKQDRTSKEFININDFAEKLFLAMSDTSRRYYFSKAIVIPDKTYEDMLSIIKPYFIKLFIQHKANIRLDILYNKIFKQLQNDGIDIFYSKRVLYYIIDDIKYYYNINKEEFYITRLNYIFYINIKYIKNHFL